MDQQQDMDAAHGDALEIHAKAGHVREVVEDIYRAALTLSGNGRRDIAPAAAQYFLGYRLANRDEEADGACSAVSSPWVPETGRPDRRRGKEDTEELQETPTDARRIRVGRRYVWVRQHPATQAGWWTPPAFQTSTYPHRTRANQCWVNAGAEGDINPFMNFVAGQRPIQTRQ